MLAGWPVGLYLTVMEPRGIYRERKGWGNQDSARVKYDERQELDLSEDRYRERADITLRLINYLGKKRLLPTTLNAAMAGQRHPGLGIGKAHYCPYVSELKGRLFSVSARRPESDDGFFAERLGGLQTMQTLNQDKARAVRSHQDRRLLAVVEHTGCDFDAFVREWCAFLSERRCQRLRESRASSSERIAKFRPSLRPRRR
jgi:hypothetical protein